VRSERGGNVTEKLVCFQKCLRAANYILLPVFATDIEQLFAAVYSRQALWQQKYVNHHNRVLNYKLWEDVALSLGSNSNFNVGRPLVLIKTLL
jgi:hypothetical protein